MRERKPSYYHYHHYHYHYYHSGVTRMGKQLCCHEIAGHSQFSLCPQFICTLQFACARVLRVAQS